MDFMYVRWCEVIHWFVNVSFLRPGFVILAIIAWCFKNSSDKRGTALKVSVATQQRLLN